MSMRLRNMMSQLARAIRLWWNVDFISGLFRTSMARTFPTIPVPPKAGIIKFSTAKLNPSSEIFSLEEQLSDPPMLWSEGD